MARMRVLLVGLLLVAALALFAVRGPLRALATQGDTPGPESRSLLGASRGNADFALVYAAARAWVTGANPYDAQGLDSVWYAAGGEGHKLPSVRGSRDLLYPPTTFVVMSPLAVLPWEAARYAWVGLNVALVFVSIGALASLAGLHWRGTGWWLLMALALAYAPLHTSIAHGQTAVMVLAPIVLAHVARVAGLKVLAGVLLGVAVVVKPHIGLPFVAYEACQGRWRQVGWALATVAAAFAIGAGRLWLAGVDWAPALGRNVMDFGAASDGAGGDPTVHNPIRHQMVNLHPLLHNFIEDRTTVGLLVYATVGVLALAYLVTAYRRAEERGELLSLTLVASLTLLIAYHRSYDAAILLFALAWLVRAALTNPSWRLLPIAIGLGVFFVPWTSALYRFETAEKLPVWLTDGRFWQMGVMMQQTWALLLLVISSLWLIGRLPRRTPFLPTRLGASE